MMKLDELKKLLGFEPVYSFSELPWDFSWRFNELKVRDSKVYKVVKALTDRAYPSQKDKYDKRWFDFYVPVKRRGFFVLVPMGIMLYERKFFLSFPRHLHVEVSMGPEKNDLFLGLMEQTLKFLPILKKRADIVERALPYDMRIGKVLGKYVLENLLQVRVKEDILKLYVKHVAQGKESHNISLNDYLNTAAICYKAAFGSKTRGLSSEEMYKRWADSRDCGMLKIKDRNSKGKFEYWLHTESSCGGHPFEIVFSMLGHGIHLFPPYPERPYFILRVTNYAYAMHFLEMIKALIRKGVAFKALQVEEVLDYLTGESYFGVNTAAEHTIDYFPGDRRLLRHIEWDEPAMLKWK